MATGSTQLINGNRLQNHFSKFSKYTPTIFIKRPKSSQLFPKGQREFNPSFLWMATGPLDHTGSNALLSHGEPSKLGTQPTFGKIYSSLASALLTVEEAHSAVWFVYFSCLHGVVMTRGENMGKKLT